MAEAERCPECGADLPPGTPKGFCPKCMLKVGLGSQPNQGGTEPAAPRNPPPTPAELGKHFPQLEILELLGQGGMGVVYKARQPRLDRLVALKILPMEPGRDPAFAERFTREARALARLSHPNIVAVHDFGESEGMFYLIMEYVDGLNLRELEQSGRLTPRQALEIVPAICDALQYAHDQGIVHRDIKPENILLDKQGRVKIADFGLAKLLGFTAPAPALTDARQVMGTPHYMAPEQIERPREVDHRADIYSLGVVFYEMLTGELPLGRFAPPSARERGMQVDVRLDEVVLRALEKDRERRYQHASDVKTDVQTIAGCSTRGPAPTAPVISAMRTRAEARQAVRGPAIGLLVTGIFNWLLLPLYVLIAGYALASRDAHGLPGPLLLALLTVFVASSLVIFASIKMKALEAYWLAICASILAILITPGNLVGLPVGIWALAVLSRTRVRQAFGGEEQESSQTAGGTVIMSPEGVPVATGQKNWASRFLVLAAGVVLAGIGLLLVVAIGAMVISITLPAVQRAKSRAQAEAAQAAAKQAALRANLAEIAGSRLGDAGVRWEDLTLSFSGDGAAGRCEFAGLERLRETDGSNAWKPIQGQLIFQRDLEGAWDFEGQQGLADIRFSVELPPSLVALRRTGVPGGVGPPIAEERVVYQALPGGRLRIEGTSSVHDWSVESRVLGGLMEFDSLIVTDPAEAVKKPAKVEVMIPVRSLKSGNPKMDEVMMETMEEQVHPRIAYVLSDLSIKEPPASAGGPCQLDAIGLLTVHGITQTNRMIVTLEPMPEEKFKVSGRTAASMTEFGMEPPSPDLGFGAIRTGDGVNISFEWLTRRRAGD